MLTKGYVFTHDRFLTPNWAPRPGQTFKDCPKATMRVNKVTSESVWYGYSWGKHITGWVMDREEFETRYYQRSLPCSST